MKLVHSKTLYLFIVIISLNIINLVGCASHKPEDIYGNKLIDIFEGFKQGVLRLNCEFSCSGKWGTERRTAKILYDNEKWQDLVIKVSNVGFKNNQTYFYLGRAAEGLNYKDAALIYYKLALTSADCDGLLNVCDGLLLPKLIYDSLEKIEKKPEMVNIKKQFIKSDMDKSACIQDSDCGDGYFCWGKMGGGKECQIRDTYIKNKMCEVDSDCSEGEFCWQIMGESKECQIKEQKLNVQSIPPIEIKNNEEKLLHNNTRDDFLKSQKNSKIMRTIKKHEIPKINNQTGKLE